jgi:hypothetical protein
MNTKRILAALTMLSWMAVASAAQAGVHRSGAAVPGAGHQGDAPPWSFACLKDSGPTECREPVWF